MTSCRMYGWWRKVRYFQVLKGFLKKIINLCSIRFETAEKCSRLSRAPGRKEGVRASTRRGKDLHSNGKLSQTEVSTGGKKLLQKRRQFDDRVCSCCCSGNKPAKVQNMRRHVSWNSFYAREEKHDLCHMSSLGRTQSFHNCVLSTFLEISQVLPESVTETRLLTITHCYLIIKKSLFKISLIFIFKSLFQQVLLIA